MSRKLIDGFNNQFNKLEENKVNCCSLVNLNLVKVASEPIFKARAKLELLN